MKKVLLLLTVATINSASASDVWVNGHVRNDGAYVQGHYRTAPDNTKSNNYSTQGNVNPYTGQPGTVSPSNSYQQPTYQYQQQQPSYQQYKQPTQQQKTCTRDIYGNVACS